VLQALRLKSLIAALAMCSWAAIGRQASPDRGRGLDASTVYEARLMYFKYFYNEKKKKKKNGIINLQISCLLEEKEKEKKSESGHTLQRSSSCCLVHVSSS
jgi:hypothetical protein